MNTTTSPLTFRRVATKEVALLTGLLFLGLAIVPMAIFWVGQTVFGPYADGGYGDFTGSLVSRIVSGDPVAWFLILSPYLGWQVLRLTRFAWKSISR